MLFLVLRPSDDDAVAPPATTRTAATSGTQATTPRPRPRPTAAPIRIAVRNGRVVGGLRRIRLGQGQRLFLVVSADVFDHVHLHGYDVMRDVAPGAPARFRLRATIPGRFEIELEDRGLLLANLEVRP